jgi:hypothetical protein
LVVQPVASHYTDYAIPAPSYTLQTVSGESIPILKLTLTLGRLPPKIWVFFANITNKFILELDTLRAYNAAVDIKPQMLRLAEEDVWLWSPGAGPMRSCLVVANDQVISSQCEGVVMARLESPFGGENGLGERSLEAHAPKNKTLVRKCRELPVRVLNSNRHDQKLKDGSPVAHCEPVTLVAPPDVEQPQVQDTAPKF